MKSLAIRVPHEDGSKRASLAKRLLDAWQELSSIWSIVELNGEISKRPLANVEHDMLSFQPTNDFLCIRLTKCANFDAQCMCLLDRGTAKTR